jgi:hypothetical protein
MRHGFFACLVLSVALCAGAACGGKAVMDGPLGGGADGAGAGGAGGEGGSPATGDPNCLALCGHETFACSSNSGSSGVLSRQGSTPTGCTWTFTPAGEPPTHLTIDCQQFCMFEAGQCYAMTWAAPGDPVALALVFSTSSDTWGCSPLNP